MRRTFKIWEKGMWKEHLHSPRQCSWQSTAALEPGSPNKAARVNREQALNQVVPVSLSCANWQFSYQPHSSESTRVNLWQVNNNFKVLSVYLGLSYPQFQFTINRQLLLCHVICSGYYTHVQSPFFIQIFAGRAHPPFRKESCVLTRASILV